MFTGCSLFCLTVFIEVLMLVSGGPFVFVLHFTICIRLTFLIQFTAMRGYLETFLTSRMAKGITTPT